MELKRNPDVTFDASAVLRGQGLDPAMLQARQSRLVKIAEAALEEGLSLLRPKVFYKKFAVQGRRHNRLLLDNHHHLDGKLLVQHLANARWVIVVLATIGDRLEQRVAKTWNEDVAYALALDSVGSAAMEALAQAICHHFEEQAIENGFQTSLPLSPGMLDWPVEVGQPQIFRLMKDEVSPVLQLTPGCMMIPRKSLSFVLGEGQDMTSDGQPCTYCAMQSTCRYQKHERIATGSL